MPTGFEMQGRNPPGGEGKPEYQSSFKQFNYKDLFRKKKYIPYWIILIVILALTALITIYHKQIIDWLHPVSKKIRSLSWGWIIPVLILVAISFPPLFGHEIVAILCGIVYGLWIGFGIVAAGTFIGEISTYYAFKGVFRKKAEKLERTDLNYSALARVTREGGFLIVFLVRLSAIPSHFSTAVFATCGLAFIPFLVATFVTLPKQLITVYLGVIIENPKGSKVISDVVLAISFVITLLCAGYVYWQMRKMRPVILAEDRKRFEAMNDSREYQEFQATHAQNDEEIGSPLLHQAQQTKQQQQQKQQQHGDGQMERRYEEYASSPYPPTYEGGGYGGGYQEGKYDAAANAPELVVQGQQQEGGNGRYEPFRTVVPVGNGRNGQARISEDGGPGHAVEIGSNSPIATRPRYHTNRENSYSDKPVEPRSGF